MQEFRCEISAEDFDRLITVKIGGYVDDNHNFNIQPAEIKRYETGETIPDTQPFFQGRERDGRAMLQAIVNEAWRFGIRPAAAQNEGAAKHLADMRKIVGKQLGVEL